jgi:DNA-binding NtrC family response regulator
MSAHLLIADDEAEIRQALSVYFRSLDYDVDCADCGISALEIMANKRIDVLISDIVMPRMDGVELLREVRKNYPMTRVVMITGYVTLDNALACMRHGADTCVFKPIEDMRELTEAVQGSLAHLTRWQEKLKELMGMRPDAPEDNHASA